MCFTKCTTAELLMGVFYQMYNSGTPDKRPPVLTICWHRPYALGVPPPKSTKHRAMQLLGMQWYHSVFI